MNNVDKQYLDLLRDIIENGTVKNTRAGKVKSLFGRQMRFSLKDGFPILTTKKVFTKGVIHELLWFIKGDTNIKYLVDNNVHIWDDDAYRHYLSISDSELKLTKEEFLEAVKEEQVFQFGDISYKAGDLGPIYGKQWRDFGGNGIDQIQNIIDTLKTNPDDRRMLCMAWNPSNMGSMGLPPCHYGFQVYTRELTEKERWEIFKEKFLTPDDEEGYFNLMSVRDERYVEGSLVSYLDRKGVPTRELSLMWMQRSVDYFLGWSFNLTSYTVLAHMIAQCANMTVGEIVCSLGDVHLYDIHTDAANEQLSRDPHKYELPKLVLNPTITNINDFTFEDIKIEGYESYPTIKAPLCVGL